MNDCSIPPRRESTDERRLAIAKAARALIAEKGFEGLRTRDIAERVGINIATLHYHVPTKEALIGLVTESIRDQFVAQHLSRPRQHLSGLEKLRLEFVDYRETAETESEVTAVLIELFARSRRDQKVRAAIMPLLERWHEIVAAILAQGQAEGDFRPDLDPHAGAQVIVGALNGFARGPEQDDMDAFERLAAELLRSVTRHRL